MTYKTHSNNFPPEQQRLLHPEYLENEKAYVRMRDDLMKSHLRKWVAIAHNRVVAYGSNLMQVMNDASNGGPHTYFAFVGAEDEVVVRIRRSVFSYDSTYQLFPMPRVNATFWNDQESLSHSCTDIIPDIGADTTALPLSDCRAIDLFNARRVQATSGGPTGGHQPVFLYLAKAEINGLRVPALIQTLPDGSDRLLGRDVLNHHRVVFDGPAGEVVFEP